MDSQTEHGHRHGNVNLELLDTNRGLLVIKVTFFVLVVTAVVEGAITVLSGSAALFADTVHGLSNASTTLPLWIAFALGRKKPTTQFPYGYQRAEDIAGIVILLFIAVTASVVGYESVRKLIDRTEPSNIPWAMVAGGLGFVANEAIAQYRIRVGRQIGSAALVADGQHARVDGLGSLAVVIGLLAVVLGVPEADPVAGLVITGLIVYLLVREAGPVVVSRVMDRIDPDVIPEIQKIVSGVPEVLAAYDIRARWAGHRLLAELSIGVDPALTIAEGHGIAEEVQHSLLHSMPKLQDCTIHVEPFDAGEAPHHDIIAHHFHEDEEHHEPH